MNAMEVLTFPEAEVPLDLRVQQIALQDQAWPSDRPSEPAPWHDPALRPRSMLLVDVGRVLTALDILSKGIIHRGEEYSASGVGAVVTDPARRGMGYGLQLVGDARRQIAEAGTDLGLFTCDGHLQAFYERAGWQRLPGTVLIGGTPGTPLPSDQLEKVTMAAFFSPRANASAEAFIGSRIELYPGEIDRLW